MYYKLFIDCTDALELGAGTSLLLISSKIEWVYIDVENTETHVHTRHE